MDQGWEHFGQSTEKEIQHATSLQCTVNDSDLWNAVPLIKNQSSLATWLFLHTQYPEMTALEKEINKNIKKS